MASAMALDKGVFYKKIHKKYSYITKFTKISIEIVILFVYNVFVAAQ